MAEQVVGSNTDAGAHALSSGVDHGDDHIDAGQPGTVYILPVHRGSNLQTKGARPKVTADCRTGSEETGCLSRAWSLAAPHLVAALVGPFSIWEPIGSNPSRYVQLPSVIFEDRDPLDIKVQALEAPDQKYNLLMLASSLAAAVSTAEQITEKDIGSIPAFVTPPRRHWINCSGSLMHGSRNQHRHRCMHGGRRSAAPREIAAIRAQSPNAALVVGTTGLHLQLASTRLTCGKVFRRPHTTMAANVFPAGSD